MDHKDITGPQYLLKCYHSKDGLLWLDSKGNPIPLAHSLGTHVSQMDPHDYWNSVKTRSKVNPYIPQANKAGTSNSTALGPNVPQMNNPNIPIVEHHIDMDTSADSALTTVKELYRDQNIPPEFVTGALSAAVSFLSPSKTVQSANDSQGIFRGMQQVSALPQLSTGNSCQASAHVEGDPRHGPKGLPLPQSTFDSSSSSHQSMAQIANSSSSTSQEMSATNTPSHTDTSGRDEELNTSHERPQLDIKNYKDTIATQSRITFECAMKELRTQYQQQMNQQEINHSQNVNAIKQQINDLATQLH